MSNNVTESRSTDIQILDAISALGERVGKLSDDVHELNNYLTRLDERIIALDNKVDNRVQGIETQVKYLEQRMQIIVDKQQDVEVRFNRLVDSHKNLSDDFAKEQDIKRDWINRYLIPLALALTIAAGSSFFTATIVG